MGSFQVSALKAADRLMGRTVYRSLLASSRTSGAAVGGSAPPPPSGAIRRVLVIRPGLPWLSSLPEGPRGRVLIVRIVVAVDAARRAFEIDQPYSDAKRESLAD